MESIEKKIAEKIRIRRVILGLTLEEVAEKAGACYKSVWSLEKGKPTAMRLFLNVCSVLGLQISLKNKED